MSDNILSLDTNLFCLINHCRNSFFDFIFSVLSWHLCIGVIVAIITLYVIYKKEFKFWYVYIILIGLCFLLSDRSSVIFFKDVFHRLRPSHALNNAITLKISHFHYVYDNKGGLYGFVSSHCANVFSIISLMSLIMVKQAKNKIEKRKSIIFVSIIGFWGIMVGYSRIYCGYHYPGDVVCGSILGILIGFLLYFLYTKIIRYLNSNKTKK
ncbi:MAG: phosphatase PAP2 family protein [Bacteroidales bacterium]|jgi:undecaprenyl-diphosphatase|nr:phosphatase PAP2 family protein [Bacteroidales bacterium]